MSEQARYGQDGRRIIDPPCDYGHTRQALECPSCSERISETRSSDEWVRWYERRYSRQKKAVS